MFTGIQQIQQVMRTSYLNELEHLFALRALLLEVLQERILGLPLLYMSNFNLF